MANFIENLGLEFLVEDEDHTRNLLGYVVENGNPITGYYGYPYLNHHFGAAQFIVRTERNDEEKRLEICGLDTHCSGNCVWEVKCTDVNLQPKDADKTERRCVVSRPSDGSGLCVVNVVNADVLPSFREDDVLKLQMVAFPVEFDYFADEDAYAEVVPEGENGRRILLSDGSILPSGMLQNHAPNSDDFEANPWMDDHVVIRGTVKGLRHGRVKVENVDEMNTFIRVLIDTQFGELELLHTYEQVKEDQRDLLKVGSTFVGVCVLSGDAAIDEYENGIVRDEEHNLRLLCDVFLGGDAERLNILMNDDTEYHSQAGEKSLIGKESIVKHIEYVQQVGSKYFAHMAQIISVDDGNEPLSYSPGKRCVVLASEEPDHYESIVFLDLDDEGKISQINLSADGRYHFQIDAPPVTENPLADFELPSSFCEAMLTRAKYHGFLDWDENDDTFMKVSGDFSMKDNVGNMLDAWPEDADRRDPELLSNMFGYLFAKAMEAENNWTQSQGDLQTHLVIGYSPADVWKGTYTTHLEGEAAEKLKRAMELGKQFYKDFALIAQPDELSDDDFNTELERGLFFAQVLGQQAAAKYLG